MPNCVQLDVRLPGKGNSTLAWREAGPPNLHDDKVDADQQVVDNDVSLFQVGGERLVIYCQTTGVSAAHATHCATYCTPCRPLIRAFSGWIRTPPPTLFSRSEELMVRAAECHDKLAKLYLEQVSFLSHTLYYLNALRKSTPPKKCQLVVLMGDSST